MSHIQKAVIFCLSGARLADLRGLSEVTALQDRGATVELDPTPITGPQAQYYQAFSGKSPASFGFFDTLVAKNYSVTEETSGRGTTPMLLPDQLRTVGWTVQFADAEPAVLLTRLQSLLAEASGEQTCVILRAQMPTTLSDEEKATINTALQQARTWVGDTGLLAVLSEIQAAPVQQYVNMNNFLADMGIIERDEQTGQINWADSLAYHAGHGQLMINLQGRDPQGAVHPQGEYEEVRDSLVKALPAKVLDVSGKAAVERVYRKEELYTGDYLFCAPDLVVLFKEGYAPSPESTRVRFDQETFTKADTYVSAGVNPAVAGGFLVAAAPSLAERVTEYERAPLTAVTPTLLHALGVEYVDMEAPAISTLFSPEYLEEHPIRSDAQNQELSAEDEELIISHLRDLGYV